jgi:hypothetical protein
MHPLHILTMDLADVCIQALRRNVDGKEEFVVSDVDHLRPEQIEVFVVDVEDERVYVIMRGTVDIGPLMFRNRGEVPVAGKQVIAMSK